MNEKVIQFSQVLRGLDHWGSKVEIQTPRLLLINDSLNNLSDFNVYEKGTQVWVGKMSFRYVNGFVHLPIEFAGEFRGLGYATEARYSLIKFVFEELGENRIVAYIHESNHSSMKLNRKLGFRVEESFQDFYDRNSVNRLVLTRERFREVEAKMDLPREGVNAFLPSRDFERVSVREVLSKDELLSWVNSLKSSVLEQRSGNSQGMGGSPSAQKHTRYMNMILKKAQSQIAEDLRWGQLGELIGVALGSSDLRVFRFNELYEYLRDRAQNGYGKDAKIDEQVRELFDMYLESFSAISNVVEVRLPKIKNGN